MVVVRPPSPALAARVDRVFWIRGDGHPGTAFHELFPDASASLVLRLSPAGCRLVLLGPVTALAATERVGDAEYLGVRFRPGQTPALADLSPRALTDGRAEIVRALGGSVDALGERLALAADDAERQALLEELVRSAPPLVRSERARRVAALVERSGGRLRVEALARAVGLHVRSLERLCRAELGMTPKRLTRLVRLRSALERLHAAPTRSLADLAGSCGYADQAHLTRELRALTGRSPGERGGLVPRRLEGAPRTAVVHRVRPAWPDGDVPERG